MASARRGESTTDDAMAVKMDRQSSGHRNSSDNDGEAAYFSQSLHKKCLNANTMMTIINGSEPTQNDWPTFSVITFKTLLYYKFII
jgi:hypothetical protein